ncbi:LOG family protein [Bacteroidota bacterium]
MNKTKRTVTVFGSSIPRPGDPEFETAYNLGKALGKKNISVCSGGYQGIMDAVSKGASETGAEAIGITVNIYNSKPSRYLTKQIDCDSLFERIDKLIEIGDGYIILSGGTGTLLELSVVWEYLNKGLLEEKPFAVHGEMWETIINKMEERIVTEKRKTGLINYFDNIEALVKFIDETLK